MSVCVFKYTFQTTSILFFHEKFHFFWLGWRMGGPITTWIEEISTPHLCIMCFITFMGSSKANLVLEKLDKKLGLADPPPQLGQNPKFFQKFHLKASLSLVPSSSKYFKNQGNVSKFYFTYNSSFPMQSINPVFQCKV